MRRSIIGVALICAVYVPIDAKQGDAPPSLYISKGACPFEGCTYREWTARRALRLLSSPDGKQIGLLKKGEVVTALTGEVRTHPVRFTIKSKAMETDAPPVGSSAYLLHPVGEGAWLIWYRGNLITFEPDYEGPWPKYQWWAKIRAKSGKVGWVLMEDNPFDNVDRFG